MAEPKEQQTIEGAADKVSRRVRDAARKYASALYQRQQLQEDEAVLKPSLLEKMIEDEVEKVEVSFKHGEATIRYEVRRKTEAEPATKIVCKKLGDDVAAE